MALLTIMGLYNYDNTIFDNLQLPTGVDKPTLVNNIILETAEMECVYPTPVFLKTAIGLWSNVQILTWERAYADMTAEYDPIENYNRYETETTTGSRGHSGKDTTTRSGTVSQTETSSNTVNSTGSETASTTNKIAGFDSTTLVDHDSSSGSSSKTAQDISSGSSTQSGTDSSTEELTHGEQIAEQGSRTAHIHGNIGVLTSTQMLRDDISLLPELNIYTYITRDFKRRFCLDVY